MKITAFVVFALIIPLSTSVHSAETKKSLSSSGFKAAVLNELRKNKFIRNPSCRMFADLILTRAGLPRVGQDAPVFGMRQDFNRTREYEALPVFEDSTMRSEHPYLEYRIKAYGHPSVVNGAWYLELIRNREIARNKRLELKTRFAFSVGTVANRPSCDLIEIHFQEPSEKLTGSYDADRCLGIFDPAIFSSGGETAVWSAIQQDCALGLRYFLSMKWSR